jgi:hypothetical protein
VAYTKMEQLLALVLRQTQAGKVRWEPTENAYAYALPRGGVAVVVESVDSDGYRPYQFSLVNPDDYTYRLEVLEQYYDDDSDTWVYPELEELYEMARRQALNIEPLMDTLISELLGLDDEAS